MNKPPPVNSPDDQQTSARGFCYACFKAEPFCLCDSIVPVDNKTRIVIVQHKCERCHPIGTARIATLALRNTELRIVWPDKVNTFTFEPQDLESTGLLYPGPGATDLAAVPADQRPRELVLLDGTWGDVKKLYKDNPWLEQLPQYNLTPTVPSRYRLRKEPDDQSISTIEAIVQALGILEPETPGIDTLITVFEEMIDRQIECVENLPPGPSRYHNRRSRHRDHRSVPRELRGSLRNLVIVDEESVPWSGKKRELIRWFAIRPHDGSVFDQFLTPRAGSTLTDIHLRHMGLCREDMNMTVLPEELERLWNGFITPEDILVTWNKGVLDLLEDNVENGQKSFYLKEAYCNTRGGKCGHVKDVVRAHGLPLSTVQLKGRAARKLSSTLAVTMYLNQLSDPVPDCRKDLP